MAHKQRAKKLVMSLFCAQIRISGEQFQQFSPCRNQAHISAHVASGTPQILLHRKNRLLSGGNVHGRTCCQLDPVVNDPTRKSERRVFCYSAAIQAAAEVYGM
jgi:hypothetical protein